MMFYGIFLLFCASLFPADTDFDRGREAEAVPITAPTARGVIENYSDPATLQIHLRTNVDNNVERYINHHIMATKKGTCIDRSLLIFGTTSSLAASAYYSILGYHFANRVGLEEGLAVVLGAVALISPSILGHLSMAHVSDAIIDHNYRRSLDIIVKNKSATDWIGQIGEGCVIFYLSVSSGAPTAYVGWDNFYPLIGKYATAVAIPCGYVRSSIIFKKLNETSDFLKHRGVRRYARHNHHNTSARHSKIVALTGKLSLLAHNVKEMNVEETRDLLERFKSSDFSSSQKLSRLFELTDNYVPANATHSRSWVRNAFGICGGVLGAVAAIVDYNAAYSAFQAVSDDHAFCSIGASGAALGHGTIMAFSGYYCFDKLYTLLSESTKLLQKYCTPPARRAITADEFDEGNVRNRCVISKKKAANLALKILPILIAAGSATPRAELSIEYVGNTSILDHIVLYCTAAGPFLIDFWSVDSFIEKMRGVTDPKKILGAQIQSISDLLWTIPDEHLDAFYARYYENKLYAA